VLRSRRGGRENDDGGRVEKVFPVVLANPKRIQSHLVRELDLLDQVAQPLARTHSAAGLRVGRRETIDADLHDSPLT
jgi:hypothetical protein